MNKELLERARIEVRDLLQNDGRAVDIAKAVLRVAIEAAVDRVELLRSSGENSDKWTITRDLAFHEAKAAIRALLTDTGETNGR